MLLTELCVRKTTYAPDEAKARFFEWAAGRSVAPRCGGPMTIRHGGGGGIGQKQRLTWIKAASPVASEHERGSEGGPFRYQEMPMIYKDILVVLDPDPRFRERLGIAAGLAERFAAHLTGLYVVPGTESLLHFGYYDPSLVDPLNRELREQAANQEEEVRQVFEDIAGRAGISAEWRPARGYPTDVAAVHGKYSDLIVLGQLDPDDKPAPLVRPRPEDVALLVGAPTLVVPYVGKFAQVGKQVLVGWNASREAKRAVDDAMPLLAAASSVTVLAINPQKSPIAHGEVPGADIALYLARHGVKAQVEQTVAADLGIGEALLSRASDLAADLLVMGCYGGSRVRELVLGGATRTILESMTLPVLMAH